MIGLQKCFNTRIVDKARQGVATMERITNLDRNLVGSQRGGRDVDAMERCGDGGTAGRVGNEYVYPFMRAVSSVYGTVSESACIRGQEDGHTQEYKRALPLARCRSRDIFLSGSPVSFRSTKQDATITSAARMFPHSISLIVIQCSVDS